MVPRGLAHRAVVSEQGGDRAAGERRRRGPFCRASAGPGPPIMARDRRADAPDAARGRSPDTNVMVSRPDRTPASFKRRSALTWNSDARKPTSDKRTVKPVRRSRGSGTFAAAACREAPGFCVIQPSVAAPSMPGGSSRLDSWNRLESGSVQRACQGLAQKICTSSISVQSASALGTLLDARSDGDATASHFTNKPVRPVCVYSTVWTRRVGRTECALAQVRVLRPPGPGRS